LEIDLVLCQNESDINLNKNINKCHYMITSATCPLDMRFDFFHSIRFLNVDSLGFIYQFVIIWWQEND
jgi:hypothetical protein